MASMDMVEWIISRRRAVVHNIRALDGGNLGKSYNALFNVRLLIAGFFFLISFFSKTLRLNSFVAFLWVPYFMILLKTNSRFFFRYIVFYFNVSLALCGVYLIESTDIWLYELGVYSEYAGAFPLFCAYYMAFLLAMEFFDTKFSSLSSPAIPCAHKYRHKNLTFGILRGLIFLCILLIGVSFCRVLSHPNFYDRLDRFIYARLYLSGIWQKIRGWLIYFIPSLLIGMNLFKRKALPLAAFAFYLFYLIWTGERYTAFSQIVFLSSSFLVIFKEQMDFKSLRAKKHSNLSLLFLVLAFLSLIFCNIINQYSQGLSSAKGLNSLYLRIAEQGQLWWRTFSLFSGKMPHISELSDELLAFTAPHSVTPYYGIYKIMYLCAPSNIVTAKIASQQGYTESSAASIYYYFGRAALMLFAVIMGYALAKLVYEYNRSIIESRILESVLWARLLMVMLNVFSMSRFYLLLRPSTLLVLFGLVLLDAMTNARKSRRSAHSNAFYAETPYFQCSD